MIVKSTTGKIMSRSAFCIGRPTQTRAAELGAEVQAQPFDVYDVGRMAVIRYPTGAVFSFCSFGYTERWKNCEFPVQITAVIA